MTFHQTVLARFEQEFGAPTRRTVKVVEWAMGADFSAVIQLDQPASGKTALVWLPYPADGETVPDIALEYPGESGRHSNTYPAPGLKKGLPALRLNLTSEAELAQTIAYITAVSGRSSRAVAPATTREPVSVTPKNWFSLLVAKLFGSTASSGSAVPETKLNADVSIPVRSAPSRATAVPNDSLPEPKPVAPRREAIPRAVQREVWQRDGGRCVECNTREKLCFDHIVPFSRGGSNTIRNIQLLCEHCNSSKGNRI